MIIDTLTRLRVLILEDNPDDAELLVRELQRANFDPDWKLVNTEQDYLAHLDPALDVILSDYFMPGFSGLQALRLLRERGLEIPFIIVSGMVGEDAAVAAMQEGAADYLLKDRLGRLGPAIVRVLENRRLRREKEQGDRELRQTEKQLANILEHVAESIIAVNEDHQIIVFNKAAEKMFGYSAQEALGQPLDLLIPDHFVKAHHEHVRKFAALPESSRPIEHRQGLAAKRKDGSEFPVEIGLSKLEADGGIILTAIMVDITERKRTEAALAEASNLLSRAEQIGHIGSWAWNIARDQVVWSDGLYRIYGLTPQEFGATYDAYLQRVHLEDRDFVRRTVETVYHESASFEFENRILRADGEIRIVYSRGEVILNDQGEPTRLLGVGIDITELKQAEQAYALSKRRFQALIEHAPDGIALLGLNGKLRQVTPSTESILGYTVEEAAEQDPALLTHPDDLPDLLGLLNDLIQNPDKVAIAQYRFRHKDGSWRWLESTISNLIAEPSVEAIVFNYRDITERKQAEEKIRQQIERLTALREIDQAITSTFDVRISLNALLTRAKRILSVDAAVVWLLEPARLTLDYGAGIGFSTNAIQNASVRLGESLAGRVAVEQTLLQIPKLVSELDDFLKEEEFVSYYGAPLIVKGKVLGVLEVYSRTFIERNPDWFDFFSTLAGQAAIAIDDAQLFESLQRSKLELEHRVAERTTELNRTNAELEHANRAKDEFLANMSHELRTPLNSILGLAESLLEQRRDRLSELQQKSLQIIESSGQHLLGLINDILDLSKIDAGKFDIFPQVFEVDSVCRSSLTLVVSQAAKKSIHLQYEADGDVSRIHADPRRLKQILVNLLTNAVKFTPEGGQVSLQVHGDAEQDCVQFSVVDTGIGIAPQDLKRLFQPFTQLDGALSRQQEGTGLGLVLVQRLTDLHGGSVQVESEPGLGSQFTINLPWGRETLLRQEIPEGDKTRTRAEPPKTPLTTDQSRGTVLLAEDNMANVLTVAEYLEGHGYEVRVAHDGLETIQMAESMNPDIILMDIHMPVMDGLESMRRLRADPRFVTTPIIALTALAMPGDRERCITAGANEYMSKPVSLKKLRDTINEMLGKE